MCCARLNICTIAPSSIIHRDIKPTNVLITRSGVAKLNSGLGAFRGVGLDGSKHEGIVYLVESRRRTARPSRAVVAKHATLARAMTIDPALL